MKEWEIEQILIKEIIAEPADGLTYETILMLPEFLEQDVDPEMIGYCLERLVERGSLERWDGLEGGDDPEMRYRLTFREGLPPPNTRRWVVRRKAAVVVAVSSGMITIEQACQIYQLTEEELLSWKHTFETHGLVGLRTTRIQQYRRGRSRLVLRRSR
jgi:hypothetical protein